MNEIDVEKKKTVGTKRKRKIKKKKYYAQSLTG